MTEVAIDVKRARADTPGCESVLHFNNAGASLSPTPVVDAVIAHLRREAEIGGYEAAAECHDVVEHTYDAIGQLINADRDEIAIVENATRAWDMAFYAFTFGPGDRLLTTEPEYASNYIALRQVAERTGATVEVIASDESGQVDTEALASMLDDRVKLVSVVHVPTQGGLVNPVAAVGAITRDAGVPFILDACQSVGQMPVDVEEIGCDILSATGRKFLRGPRGTGFLWVRRELIPSLEPPFLDLHAAEWLPDGGYTVRSDARRFENWETNYATKIGLGVAVDYALAWGLDPIRDRVTALAAILRLRLAALGGVRVHDRGVQLSAIVTFTVDGLSPLVFQEALARQGINVSVSLSAYSRLDLGRRGLESVIRASVHYFNTETEVNRFVDAIGRLTGTIVARRGVGPR